ncbi:MAG: 30S ribosomal protein S2 [Patescibacteria group bacterium]
MVNIPSTEELLEAVVYFGHRVSKRHPKMAPYLWTIRNGIYWINLEKTKECLKKAVEFVQDIASKGGTILFVGTKPPAQEIIKKYAEEVKMPYVIERWIGGTLTNFSVISNLIEKLKKMEEDKEKGEWEKYPKKEKIDLERELKRLTLLVGGMKNLEKIPEALYIVDLREEKTALREARKAKIKIIGLVDVNADPTLVDYPIPGNDDARKSIEIITKTITEAIKEGQNKQKTYEEEKN